MEVEGITSFCRGTKAPLSTGDAPSGLEGREPRSWRSGPSGDLGETETSAEAEARPKLGPWPEQARRVTTEPVDSSRWGDASTAGRSGSQGAAPGAFSRAGDHAYFGSGVPARGRSAQCCRAAQNGASIEDHRGIWPDDPRRSSPPVVASDFARMRRRNVACRATLRRRWQGRVRPRSQTASAGSDWIEVCEASDARVDNVRGPLLGIPTPRAEGPRRSRAMGLTETAKGDLS